MIAYPPSEAFIADKEAVAIPVKDSFLLDGQLLCVDEWLHCKAVQLLNQIAMYKAKMAMDTTQSNC
jgi:hypothetical protein